MVRTVEPWHMKALEKNIERWENCVHNEPAIFETLFGLPGRKISVFLDAYILQGEKEHPHLLESDPDP